MNSDSNENFRRYARGLNYNKINYDNNNSWSLYDDTDKSIEEFFHSVPYLMMSQELLIKLVISNAINMWPLTLQFTKKSFELFISMTNYQIGDFIMEISTRNRRELDGLRFGKLIEILDVNDITGQIYKSVKIQTLGGKKVKWNNGEFIKISDSII